MAYKVANKDDKHIFIRYVHKDMMMISITDILGDLLKDIGFLGWLVMLVYIAIFGLSIMKSIIEKNKKEELKAERLRMQRERHRMQRERHNMQRALHGEKMKAYQSRQNYYKNRSYNNYSKTHANGRKSYRRN